MNTPAPLPFALFTNLGRLGNAGDQVDFAADSAQLEAIARWSDVLALTSFTMRADLVRLGPTRFRVAYRLTADVIQACVVTLDPVPAHLARDFIRDLHFTGSARHGGAATPDSTVILDLTSEDGPEEIDSLHYDLAGPALEEYVLALDPYPRRPGITFTMADDADSSDENPFAALKALKNGE